MHSTPDVPLPPRVATLPIDPQRGVPVPWFVHWTEDGKPEFRIIGRGKFDEAVRFKKCWVCGQERGRWSSFVIGPMCSITRTTAEPPCHLACAIYAARACPFLTKPYMRRRDFKEGQFEDATSAGYAIKRNPGVAVVWTTDKWKLFPDDKGRPLIEMGDPQDVLWFAEGRRASRGECLESIDGGYPILEAECEHDKDPPDSRRLLADMRRAAEVYLPDELNPDKGDPDAAQGIQSAEPSKEGHDS